MQVESEKHQKRNFFLAICKKADVKTLPYLFRKLKKQFSFFFFSFCALLNQGFIQVENEKHQRKGKHFVNRRLPKMQIFDFELAVVDVLSQNINRVVKNVFGLLFTSQIS